MIKNIILFLAFVILVSCNPLENKLEGGWVVDQAYYNDEPVIWDLYGNAIILNKNNTCDLPMIGKIDILAKKRAHGMSIKKMASHTLTLILPTQDIQSNF